MTLLLLPRQEDQPKYSAERILELLDAPASAPGWKPLKPVVKETEAYVENPGKVEAIRNSGKKVPCEYNAMSLRFLSLTIRFHCPSPVFRDVPISREKRM